MIQRTTPRYRRSQGFTLLVSLILLLVMTLIGVAAIDTSSMQAQMSRNSLDARKLFQANLSEIQAQYRKLKGHTYMESVLNSTTSISSTTNKGITCTGPGISLPSFVTYDANAPYTQSGYIVKKDDCAVSERAPLEGFSITEFDQIEFEINTLTAVTGSYSESNQTQGVKKAVPPQG